MREQGPSQLARSWEQGPFPALPVAPIPAEAVELMERALGRRVDIEAIALWERVRLFVGFAGPALTPQLEQLQLGEHGDWPDLASPGVASAVRTIMAPPPTATGLDALAGDLGD